MGALSGISADSKSTTRMFTSNPVSNSDNGSLSQNNTVNGRAKLILGDVITLGGGAQLTYNSLDGEVVAASNKLVGDAITAQARLTRDSVAGYSELAMTKLTDGANLTKKSTEIAIIAVAGVGAVIALAVWLKR